MCLPKSKSCLSYLISIGYIKPLAGTEEGCGLYTTLIQSKSEKQDLPPACLCLVLDTLETLVISFYYLQ